MPAYRAMSQETIGQSVYIATAAYESVKAGYALSLAKTVEELTRRNIPRSINIMFGNCHVDDGRNEMVRDFLDNTTCTDLVFVDADVMWEPDVFLRLLRHETTDIVAGAYPFKSDSGKFPIGKILGGKEGGKGASALLSVSYAPTGFMRIPRSVFTALAGSSAGPLNPGRRFFERRYTDKTYDGGDVTFCRKWIAAGGTVYVDPTLTLTHIGEKRWTGNFSSYLRGPENAKLHTTESKDPIPAYRASTVEMLRSFPENPSLEDFDRLADAYGNKPWAATGAFLYTAYGMARALPARSMVLECGSGLSTAVLAKAGVRVVAVEEENDRALKTDALLRDCGLDADIKVAPLGADGWYANRENLAGLNAALIVIDGPRRREGVHREWPVLAEAVGMHIVAPDAAMIMDDTAECSAPGEFVSNGDVKRPFVAGRLGHVPRLVAAE